jgi:hypothetical protein
MCVAGGYCAGKRASEYLQTSGSLKPLNPEEVNAEKARVFEPLSYYL